MLPMKIIGSNSRVSVPCELKTSSPAPNSAHVGLRAPTRASSELGKPSVTFCERCREPHEWRAVPGFARYEASRHGGLVRNALTGKILKPFDNKGYGRYDLIDDGGVCRKKLAHVVQLETFCGPCPPGMECRHLNGVRMDNCYPRNLAWGTKKENGQDRAVHGTSRGKLLADMAGRVFGSLTAIRRVDDRAHNATWLCLCACGNEYVVRGDSLRRGACRACRKCAVAMRYAAERADSVSP